MDDLEARYDTELKGAVNTICTDFGYEDAHFFAKMDTMGSVMTCLSMASKDTPSSILTFLKDKKRLELSPEAIMIKIEYTSLFPPEILSLCEEKLQAAGFSKPAAW